MSPWLVQSTATFAVCALLFAFAFVAAPHSCEWGLGAYLWVGVGAIVVLIVIPWVTPFVMGPPLPLWQRGLLSLALGTIGAATWLAGLFASNMRIICRLI